ncbi:MAG: hypothetical protein A3K19_26950 [Lentisphaerae bacterium RIFOXYB12_FULL_65_16]|nr:MAG: hypothetical protein A3K18_23925 [Lentisphaerae bacterium RIFOXYA12_64_32]OGV88037.1 MAG: hypothetical protein A3K19_26950 [Lentisphaerae bacterium RIFOXYB12_FULL_65_16]
MELLENLHDAGVMGVGLGDLATRARLKPPTAHNLLKTLVQLQYATHDPQTRRYNLGPRARVLGRAPDAADVLARVSAPALQALQERLRETAILAVYRDGLRHTLLTFESSQELRVGAGCGVDSHLYSTATGRILLSQIPAPELNVFIDTHGLPSDEWRDVRTLAQLHGALDGIRQARFAHYDRPEGHVAADAVPLPLRRDDLVAAIGVHYPRVRTPADGDQALKQALTETAVRIAQEFQGAA